MQNLPIQIFNFENQNIRVFIKNNQPWFLLVDVCRALKINNPSDVKNRLKTDGVDTIEVIDSLNRKQTGTIINESNLYRAVLQSRTEKAIEFQDWLTEEVLPQIRKTGSYNSNELQSLPAEQQVLLFAKELIKKDEEVKQLTRKTEKQQEVIDKYVVVGNNKNYTEVAKILHIAPHKFIDYLKDNKYIMFNRMPYQKYLANEYFIIKTSDKGYERYLITPKGFEYFSKKMIV